MLSAISLFLLWLVIAAPFAVFVYQFLRLRRGVDGRLKGTLRFVVLSFIPVLAYVLLSLLLVGVEQATAAPIIGEGYARMFLPVVAMGVGVVAFLTLIFVLAIRIFCRGSKRPRAIRDEHRTVR